jgi:hypothetical protein
VKQLLLYGPVVLGALYVMGWGTCRLLLPPSLRGCESVFAPWIGMTQTTLILALLGYFGIGVERSWPVAVAGGIAVLGVAWVRGRARGDRSTLGRIVPPVLVVVVVVAVVLAPAVSRTRRLNTFTLGNSDPFSYVLSAQWVREHGLFPRPTGPRWHATADGNIEIQLGYNPRWLPILELAFLSSLSRADPVRLFSLFQTIAFALQLTLVWALGRYVFGLGGLGLAIGVAAAALNPYALYVALHGFMPQVLGTGFLLGLCIALPPYLEVDRRPWREGALVVMLGTGVLTSYLELVPFALFVLGGYAGWTAWRLGRAPERIVRAAAAVAAIAVLNPFHVSRVVGFLWSHVMAIEPGSAMRSGWPMPDSYVELAGLLSAGSPPRWRLFLAVVVVGLAGWGLARVERPVHVLLLVVPSAVTALIAWRADYSYAFFKGLTYVYFWLPLLVGAGVAGLVAWRPSRPAVRWAVTVPALFAIAVVLTNEYDGAQRWRKEFTSRHVPRAPLELARLEKFNRDPQVNDVFIRGLDYWESLWAVYYLRDKRIGMPHRNEHVHNEAGHIDEGRWRYLLQRSDFRPMLGGGRRRIEETLRRTDRFSFERLAPSPWTRLGTLAVGRGFYPAERDARQEWAWAGREAEVLIDWDGQDTAILAIEIASEHRQVLRVILNGHEVAALSVEPSARLSFAIPLRVEKGRNTVVIASDVELSPQPNDPRALNLRVFRLAMLPGDRTGARERSTMTD